MELWEVKQLLNDRVEEVCALLLSAGFKRGERWTCGDAHNTPPKNREKGGSLIVDLCGPRVGRWKDFASGEGGSLIDLWMVNQGCDFRTALKQIRERFGLEYEKTAPGGKFRRVTSAAVRNAPPPTQQRGKRRDLAKGLKPVSKGSAVWKWLTEGRQLSIETIEDFRVFEKRVKSQDGTERECVVFPYFDHGGELVMVKMRDVADKSYMPTWSAYEGEKPMLLFGHQAEMRRDSSTELCLTEGEIDAMTLHELGFCAVSLPYGAKALTQYGKNPNDAWIEHEYEWLAPWERIFLCLDSDDPGRAALAAIVPRLGRERCMIVDWPAEQKDANGCHCAGVNVFQCFRRARDLDPPELKKPSDFAKEIWREFFPEAEERLGESPLYDVPLRFRPSEMTVWHGYDGGGKTVCLNYAMIAFGLQQRRCCVASLEIKGSKTFRNVLRQAMGCAKPRDEAHFDVALRWLDRWMWIYDRVGEVNLEDAVAVFEYAAKKYGVTHFVLDALMRLGDVDEEDTIAAQRMMNRLHRFVDDYDCHLHLVCHSRKPDARHPAAKFYPPKDAVSGSKAITALADNVVCVWRNREKELKLQELLKEENDSVVLELDATEPDARFIVQKQRETGWEGVVDLWFDSGEGGSWQFRESGTSQRAIDWIEQSEQRDVET